VNIVKKLKLKKSDNGNKNNIRIIDYPSINVPYPLGYKPEISSIEYRDGHKTYIAYACDINTLALQSSVNVFYTEGDKIYLKIPSISKNLMAFARFDYARAKPTADYSEFNVSYKKRRNAPKSLLYGCRKTKTKIAWGGASDSNAVASMLHQTEIRGHYKHRDGEIYMFLESFMFRPNDRSADIMVAKIEYCPILDATAIRYYGDGFDPVVRDRWQKVKTILEKSKRVKSLIDEYFDVYPD
jgi:hypothetical protein